jgi:hypothetical protein
MTNHLFEITGLTGTQFAGVATSLPGDRGDGLVALDVAPPIPIAARPDGERVEVGTTLRPGFGAQFSRIPHGGGVTDA